MIENWTFLETMIVALRLCSLLVILAVMTLSGCGGDGKGDLSKERLASMSGGKLVEATPLSGVVLVDGSPAEHVYIYANSEAAAQGSILRYCRTNKEGKFCFTTNLECDGLESGNYALTFKLMPKVDKGEDIGPDLFKGKYKNPKKSEYNIKVEAGKPQTEVKIELKK